jgi:hypothetical protein
MLSCSGEGSCNVYFKLYIRIVSIELILEIAMMYFLSEFYQLELCESLTQFR